MPKSKRSKPTPKNPTDAVRNSRATVSGPAAPSPAPAQDDLAAKAAGTQELASAFPFNANKAAEYDPAAAMAPAGRAVGEAERSDRRREHRDRDERLGEGRQRVAADR